MSERCPLVGSMEWTGFYGYIWDTGLPDECQKCYYAALQDDQIPKTVEKIDLSNFYQEGSISDHTDRYVCIGLKPVAGNDTARRAIQDIGVDTHDMINEGPSECITSFEFNCRQATD